MGKRFLSLILAAGAMFVLSLPAAQAQGRRGMSMGRKAPARPEKPVKPPKQTPIDQFKKMTPVERQQEMAKLPAERREKLQRQLEHYNQLTPAQKERLDWFNQLPPERQTEFRKAYQKFQSEPPDRQQAMRQELQRLKNLSEDERKARLTSPEFQNRYSKGEQRILTDMAGPLPPE